MFFCISAYERTKRCFFESSSGKRPGTDIPAFERQGAFRIGCNGFHLYKRPDNFFDNTARSGALFGASKRLVRRCSGKDKSRLSGDACQLSAWDNGNDPSRHTCKAFPAGYSVRDISCLCSFPVLLHIFGRAAAVLYLHTPTGIRCCTPSRE